MLDQKGQSLLEITISIGIAAIIITALTVITITGLRNTQFAQNQSQATKYAQDWIEQVRTIRDRDGWIMISSNPTAWSGSGWNNCGEVAGCSFTIGSYVSGSPSTCNATLPTSISTPCLFSTSVPQTITGTIFSRKITIRDCNAKPPPPAEDPDPKCTGKQRKVTVEVSWVDASGTHKSQLSTILAN
jgi:type II secretory pathway pseudopilin PulG